MTSNIGAEHLLAGGTEDRIAPDARDRVLAELRGHFRPEFLNRIDDIVVFNRLTLAQIERIVDLQLDEVRARLAERTISLELTEPARLLIAQRGFDPVYGARPLRRFIAHDVETRIARALVAGDLTDGSTIVVDARDGEIVVDFRVAREPAEAGRR